MVSRLTALTFDARDPVGLARFWSGVLGRDQTDDVTLRPPDGVPGFALRFVRSLEPKRGPNQMHFDIVSQTLEEQQETVARALDLGGRPIDVGQLPEEEHVVLADPEGNEFCVTEPGNRFLADTDFIGAVSSDGTREVGCFWSEVLGWPLVWDQDEETAIQSPGGGSKISWGGPPFNAKRGKNRLHFDLSPVDGDQAAEVERLIALGARRIDIGQGDVPWVVLADLDGNEFCLLPD